MADSQKKKSNPAQGYKPKAKPVARLCRKKNEDLKPQSSSSKSKMSDQKKPKTPVPEQKKTAKLTREPTPPTSSSRGSKDRSPLLNGNAQPSPLPEVSTPSTEFSEEELRVTIEENDKEEKPTTPVEEEPLTPEELRALRAELARKRREAKGDFPDHDAIRARKPGQLPWRKRKDLPAVDISRDDGYDSDLEAEMRLIGTDGVQRKEYDITGKETYLEACEKLATTPISSFLKNLQNNKFSLKYRGVGIRSARALAAALEVNPYIEQLILCGNFIEGDGGFVISESLRDNIYVMELDLGDNCLGGVGALSICDMLSENKTLHTLDLSGNGLVDADAEVFHNMLVENRTLKKLILSYNHFEAAAGKYFGDALAENDTLEYLDLSWNHLRLEGARLLCRGLLENVALKHLDVSMNGFGMEGARAVAEALKVNRTLQELDISRNRIPEAAGALIGLGLKMNETLRILRGVRNPFLPDGAIRILQGIEKNEHSGMEFLDLSETFVNRKFVELKDKLEKDRVMRILHGSVINDEDYEIKRGLVMEVATGIMDDPMTKVRNYCDKAGLRLIDLFKQFDKDQSMTLTREEITKGIKSRKIKMSKKEIDALLDQLDTDGDGEVDYGELVFGDKMHRGVRRRVKAMDIERGRRMSVLAEDPSIKAIHKQVGMAELVEEVMWIEDNRSEWHKKVRKIREERESSSSESEEEDDAGRRKGILSGTA